ncbi:transposase [uncultured Phenylobacterium sp.]|uniref:transposase n=1 Tax=uncultured Phenylobacterium sp. TaxID=349273 RepID=UPI00345C827C
MCLDDRRVLNGTFWRLRTGAPWADIPDRDGPHTICVNRVNRWRKVGVWDRRLKAVSPAYEGDIQMIDSSSIRVHQHGTNAKRRRPIRLPGSFARRSDHRGPRPGGTPTACPSGSSFPKARLTTGARPRPCWTPSKLATSC